MQKKRGEKRGLVGFMVSADYIYSMSFILVSSVK